jgi:Cupin
MMAPNYNSRATKITMVVQGCADIEMACPHLSRQSREEEERESEWEGEEERERRREREHRRERGEERHSYSLIRSRVCCGDVFVIPASHPVVAVASGNKNAQLLCFGIRAEDNRKIYLAGKLTTSVIKFHLFLLEKE